MRRSLPIVFILVVLLVVIYSVNNGRCTELLGGGIYTTFAFPKLNNLIDEYNSYMRQTPPDIVNIDSELGKINNAYGFYGGGSLHLDSALSIGIICENLTTNTGYEATYYLDVATFNYTTDIKLSFRGLMVTSSYRINDYLTIGGGGGYYFGTMDIDTSIKDYDEEKEDWFVKDQLIDLGGLGFKVGVSANYPLTEHIKVHSKAHYRILGLDAEDDIVLEGTDYLQLDTPSLNAKGVELRAGISYLF